MRGGVLLVSAGVCSLGWGCVDLPVSPSPGPAGSAGGTELPSGGGGSGGSGGGGGGGGSAGGGGGADRPSPVCGPGVAPPCASIEDLRAGGTFTCARFDDGTTRCFGFNDSHQLGDPSVPASAFESGVVAGPSLAAIALGHRHACGLHDDDRLSCWGRNLSGQLGTGDQVFGVAPRLVLEGAGAVSTTMDATCAIRAGRTRGGEVACWGFLLDGQPYLGIDGGQYTLDPTPVPMLDDALELSVGTNFACARGEDTVRCWGHNGQGQLGDGTTTSSAVPVAIASGLPSPVVRIAAGAEHVCALAGDPAAVHCWGRLPLLDQVTTEPTALATQPEGEVLALGSGWHFSCALSSTGRVQCWGFNGYGALGHGGGASAIPVNVANLTTAVALAVGYQHACALTASGALYCWGRNDHHQLGGASSAPLELTPVLVSWP